MTEHDEALVEDLARLIDIERSEHVYEWPEDEATLHRRPGWRSFDERSRAVADLRRQKIARAVLDRLVELGWRPPAPEASCHVCGAQPVAWRHPRTGRALCRTCGTGPDYLGQVMVRVG